MPLPCDGMGSGLQCSTYLHLMHITVPRCFVTLRHPLVTNNVQLSWGSDQTFRSAAAAYHSTGLYICRSRMHLIFPPLTFKDIHDKLRRKLTKCVISSLHKSIKQYASLVDANNRCLRYKCTVKR